MLDSVEIWAPDRFYRFEACIRGTYPLVPAFEFWMAYAARDLLRLGVYFRALSIMIQVPGATDYRCLVHDDLGENKPPEADNPYVWLCGVNREIVLSVLTECLRRLDADGDLIEQIPEAKNIERIAVTPKWHKYLNREAKYECGLLNVVAECLDELIVRPGFVEIDRVPRPKWWQERWAQIRKGGYISIPVEPRDNGEDE